MRASLDQSKTSTKQKTKKPSQTRHMICGNNYSLSRNVGANEASKIAVNVRVVIFGKVQTDKDGISTAKSEYLTFLCVISCYRTSLRSYSKKTTSTDW